VNSISYPLDIAQQRLQLIDDDSICKPLSQYDGQELQDKKTFEFYARFYGISEGTTLLLSHRAQVIVFVKTLTGKTFTCSVALGSSVDTLKLGIQERELIPMGTPLMLMSFLRLIAS
jgi:hypothetical protein